MHLVYKYTLETLHFVCCVLLVMAAVIAAFSSLQLHPRYRLAAIQQTTSRTDLVIIDRVQQPPTDHSLVVKDSRVRPVEQLRLLKPTESYNPHYLVGVAVRVFAGWGGVVSLYTHASTLLLLVVIPGMVVLLIHLRRMSMSW